MKRSIKLVALLAAVVLLVCGYLIVKKLNTNTTTVEEVSISLIDTDAADITGMSWQIDDAMFTLNRTDDGWEVDGDADFPVDTEQADELADAISKLTAESRITDVASLEDYGLSSPTFAVTVTKADGTWCMISQGSTNSLSGNVYMQVTGSDDVYAVTTSLADVFDLGKEDLLAMESIPVPDDVMTIEITSADRSLELSYYEDGTGESYKDADGRLTDSDAVSTFLTSVKALEWTGCVSYAADDAERAEFGISDPTARINITYTSDDDDQVTTGEFTLVLGGTSSDGGSVYAALTDDSTMIYTISAEDAQMFTDALEGGLESSQVFNLDTSTITRVTVEINGTSTVLEKSAETVETAETADSDETAELDVTAGETSESAENAETVETAGTGSESAEAESTVWLVNGEPADNDAVERLFTDMGMVASVAAEEEYTGDIYITFTVECSDGSITTVMLSDEDADTYGLTGTLRGVAADEIDAMLRLVRHLAK